MDVNKTDPIADDVIGDASGMGMFAPIPSGTIAAPAQSAAAAEENKQMG